MKILLVRHAEPDYTIDSLTPKGRREAELLSRRLCKLDVKNFYVSPQGRARDTASYTLNKLNRTAEVLPWLAEFRGRCFNPAEGRQDIPWDYRPREWNAHPEFYQPDAWLKNPQVQDGTVQAIWDETVAGLDGLLAQHGYHRDGPVYRCEDNKPDTLVFFCHFGISMALLSHLCGIPPIPLWQCFCMQPSSVTTIITEERIKGEVSFRCMGLGDLSHLYVANEPYSTAGLFSECYTGSDSTCPPECVGKTK